MRIPRNERGYKLSFHLNGYDIKRTEKFRKDNTLLYGLTYYVY